MDRWLTIDEDDLTWEIDAEFLRSNWRCIWDAGCAGIEATPAVEAQLGCCSVGAQLLDQEEAMLITALAATLDDEHAQYAHEIRDGGALNHDRTNTRLVDGACIFLNRPEFPGGAGCALHATALASGESPIDWKPSVCWQLPLKIERHEDDQGRTVSRLRAWQRKDWGGDGETMAFCCTEPGDAYVGEQPVHVSLKSELTALLGDDVVEEITRQLS